MTELSDDLVLVGDSLQQAWRNDHRGRTQAAASVRPRRALLALAIVSLLGTGAAIAGSVLKSAADEQTGLVKGYQLFAGSRPVCEQLSSSSFQCVLAESPDGMTFYDEDGTQRLDVFLGMKAATVDSTRHVDGACVSVSADGRRWQCFLGEEAVYRDLIRPDRLGAYLPDTPTG